MAEESPEETFASCRREAAKATPEVYVSTAFSARRTKEMQDLKIAKMAVAEQMWRKHGHETLNARWTKILEHLQRTDPLLFGNEYTVATMSARFKYIVSLQARKNARSAKDSGVDEDPPSELEALLTAYIDEESAIKRVEKEAKEKRQNERASREAARTERDSAAVRLVADAASFRKLDGSMGDRSDGDGSSWASSGRASPDFPGAESTTASGEDRLQRRRRETEKEGRARMSEDQHSGLCDRGNACGDEDTTSDIGNEHAILRPGSKKRGGSQGRRARSPKLVPREAGIDGFISMMSKKCDAKAAAQEERDRAKQQARQDEIAERERARAWEKERFFNEQEERNAERRAAREERKAERDADREFKLEMQKMLHEAEEKRTRGEHERLKMVFEIMGKVSTK